MKLLTDILKWVSAVVSVWYGWVGASATAGIVGFGQGMGWWGSPGKRVYIALLVAGSVISAFGAWRKQYQATVKAELDAQEEIRKRGRPELAVSCSNFNASGYHPFVFVNTSDQVAVHIQVQDLECAGKKLRFLPLDLLRKDGSMRCPECYIEGSDLPSYQLPDVRSFYESGWDGIREVSDPFSFRATYFNVDNEETATNVGVVF